MLRLFAILAALLPAFTVDASDAVVTDQETGLIVAPGWELVRANCGGCHSHQLVISQHADRQTWLDLIRWMQSTQNLWQFDVATEESLLDYLALNYPPPPNRRRAPIPATLMPPPETSRTAP